MSHHAVDVIRAKRDGRELSDAQIHWFIEGDTRGGVAPEQASALLMAIVWQGMTPRELDSWTDAMIRSGTCSTSPPSPPKVDKHSTGGVGDKVSLPLARSWPRAGRRADGLRPRPRPHRRHARQARGDPRLPLDLAAAEVARRSATSGA